MVTTFRSTILAISLLLSSSLVTAGVIYTQPVTSLNDDSITHLINSVILNPGDRLQGVFEISSTNGGAIAPTELTGIYDITVLSKVSDGGTGFDYTFGPSSGGLFSSGTMIRFYEDVSNDLDLTGSTNCSSPTDCLSKAGFGGTGYLSLGFSGDTDEFWAANLVDLTTAEILALPSTTVVGSFSNALSILENNTGVSFGSLDCPLCTGDGEIDWLASGTFLGGGSLTNGFFARGDMTGFLAPIPEPGSMSLLLAALLGLFAVGFCRTQESITGKNSAV
ncbi:MAG: hypothetical protein V7707_12335 [Motiliproteus sp.]